MSKKYSKVVLGGTFDRLHKGHEALLSKAFEISETVVIGLTTQTFLDRHKPTTNTLNYNERSLQLKNFIDQNFSDYNYDIVPIDNLYGTTLTDSEIQAIVVSDETIAGAQQINQKRLELGLKKLDVEIIELVPDEDSDKLASTKIRAGEVNRLGNVYSRIFTNTLVLNEYQRSSLKKPMGILYRNVQEVEELKNDRSIIVLVGDQTVSEFLKAHLQFTHAITDGKTQRVTNTDLILIEYESLVTLNMPGQISKDSVLAISQLLSKEKAWLQVDGEEDLMVLPSILLAPLGSLVVYGQPNQGVVIVEVTEESKDNWYNFLKYPDKISV